MRKSYAIILAGGSGTRLGGDVPKQYRMLLDEPVLCYALHSFEKSNVDGIIIVTAQDMSDYVRREIVEKYNVRKVVSVTTGGAERYLSVWRGLQCVPRESYVLVHDGARPFVSAELINRMLDGARQYGACIPAVPVKDTIKQIKNNQVDKTLTRSELFAVQTPQSFEAVLLYEAYEKYFQEEKYRLSEITDDSMLVEAILGKKVTVIQGDYCNIKITTPEDMLIAEIFAKKQKKVLTF